MVIIKSISMKTIRIILCISFFLTSCDKLFPDEKLSLQRIPYNGNEIQTDGYYYSYYVNNNIPPDEYIVGFFLYRNGVMLSARAYGSTNLNIVEKEMLERYESLQKEKIGWWNAFLIGVAQAIAVLPGLSRSGATISTGLLLGNKKENMAKFSFLMVLIPVLGEAMLDGKKMLLDGVSAPLPPLVLLAGFATAFITGCFACKWMLSIVKKGKLIYFAAYCVLIGLLAILGSAFF